MTTFQARLNSIPPSRTSRKREALTSAKPRTLRSFESPTLPILTSTPLSRWIDNAYGCGEISPPCKGSISHVEKSPYVLVLWECKSKSTEKVAGSFTRNVR